ncbi:MAG: SUMF1/EgtB/PvdO family nonheme iron enzyme [Polyangiaceae bacterium]
MQYARTLAVLAGVACFVPLAVHVARADGPKVGLAAAIEQEATRRPAPLSPECADGMVLVEGLYCPRVEQRCLRWLDPPGRYHEYRCAEYAKPARCLSPREHRRFCIDRRERADAETGLPLNVQSWTDAARACEAAGARVCDESEWNFACEGEEMRPSPYGWRRDAGRCNADRVDLLVPGQPWRLRDEREPAGAHPACASPFGLLDMAGNVAEWVSVDGFANGSLVVQKGNWWQPGKHACRDAQGGHDRFYKGTETGFRCCDSPAP